MAEGKIDLPDDLLSSSTPKENEEGKLSMGFLEDVKDHSISESNIPLSPQWLYAKPSDAKPDIRGPNSLSLGNLTDSTQKGSDKKDWRKLGSENESTRRWREEERETGLLGRRGSRKTDRRVENVSVREAVEARSLPSSERWHDATNRNSPHETRRDSKWSSRWGPEDKEKDSRPEKKTDVEKEDTHYDAQSVPSGNRNTESRDKWRPRHRMESNPGAPTPYRAAPGFGHDKARADAPNMGFTVGRGRSSSAPLIKPPLGSPVGTFQVDKSENIPGKPSISAESFRYPRGKLLDIYRLQKLDPTFAIKPDSMEEVPSLTQVEAVEPLAFVVPDAEEEATLRDIWKGKLTSSGASYNPSRQGKVLEAAAGGANLDLSEGKLGTLPANIAEPGGVSSQDPANGDAYQAEERNATYAEDFEKHGIESEGLMSSASKVADITKADGDHHYVTRLGSAENWQSANSLGMRHHLLDDVDRATFDISSKLPDGSSSLFVAQSFEDSRDKHMLYVQSERDASHVVDGIPPEELTLYYRDPQGEIQGPFLGVDIISWLEQGFFGSDLPVRLADDSEQAPFRELGDVMPHLKVQEGHGISADLRTKMEDPSGSAATSEINELSTLNGQNWRLAEFENRSNQPPHSRVSEHDIPSQLAYSGGIGFHDSSPQDEEIVFPGRPGSGGNHAGRILRSADGPLTNSVGYPSHHNELKESGMPLQTDDKLHPFGLLWSELQGTDTRQAQPSHTPSSIGMSNNLMVHSSGISPFGGAPEGNVDEAWSKFYDKGPVSNANIFGDLLENQHFTHLEPEPNHHELAGQQMISRQLQQQQLQQRNILSQLTHLNDPSLEPVPGRNSIQQQLANQPLSELEHFLALQQQRQLELQQQHLLLLQQQHQLQEQQIVMQEQQSQARHHLLEQVLRGNVLDPAFRQSHLDSSGANSVLDQMLLKQQLLHDTQARPHHHSRHSDPYIEQLIQAKLGQATHQEHEADLLELMQHARQEQFRSQQMLQQEQLQARQMSMGLRQRPDMGEGRPMGSVWPVDEAEQFLRNPVGPQRANSAAFSPPAFSPIELFQQQLRASHEEQLGEYERNLQLQERIKRGLYDPGVLPFEQPVSLPGGGPGMNLDMVNAMARLQGLDIQDPNGHMRSASQLGSFSSGNLSHHPHHPLAPNEFNVSHFEADGRWPDNDSRMSNDWIDTHIQQLHINAEKQKREQQLDEDNSKRLLMELLHQKSIHQSPQPLNLNEGTLLERRMASGIFPGSSSAEHLFSLAQDCDASLNNPAAVPSFANISGEQAQLRLSEDQAGGFESSGRFPGRSNSGIFMEGESTYPGINQNSTLMYTNSSASNKSFIDREFSEPEGKRRVAKLEEMIMGSALDIQENMLKQPVMTSLDGREIPTSSISRQNSLGITGGQGGFFSEKIGRSNSFTEEIAGERVPTVLSRGSENVLLKRPPVSRPLSSQEGLSDPAVDPVTKGTSAAINIPDGGRCEVGGNAAQAPDNVATKKDMRFRRTNSCSDADVSETSFIDMLKSNAKKPPQPEVYAAASESADGSQGGKSGKKKGKKGRQIDPALLGFKVTSNRIMMGEIQRIDD